MIRRPGAGRALALCLTAKLLTAAVLLAVFYAFPDMHRLNLWNRIHDGRHAAAAAHLPFVNWDGQHYLRLAEDGYAAHPQGRPFFPLFPLALRAAGSLTGSLHLGGLLLNLILSAVFCLALDSYARLHLGSAAAPVLLFTLAWPTAFYLTVLYAEALFLALLFGFLYLYDGRQSRLSLLPALLLPLARPQAALAAAALLAHTAWRQLRGDTPNWHYEAANLGALTLGSLLYLGFFQAALGNPLAGLQAQVDYVFGNSLLNVLNPRHFAAYLLAPTQGLFNPVHALADKLCIAAMLASAVLVWRAGNRLWLILYLALAYPPAAMGHGGSYTRLSLAAAPFLALALACLLKKRTDLLHALAIALGALQLLFAGRFALNLWVA